MCRRVQNKVTGLIPYDIDKLITQKYWSHSKSSHAPLCAARRPIVVVVVVVDEELSASPHPFGPHSLTNPKFCLKAFTFPTPPLLCSDRILTCLPIRRGRGSVVGDGLTARRLPLFNLFSELAILGRRRKGLRDSSSRSNGAVLSCRSQPLGNGSVGAMVLPSVQEAGGLQGRATHPAVSPQCDSGGSKDCYIWRMLVLWRAAALAIHLRHTQV